MAIWFRRECRSAAAALVEALCLPYPLHQAVLSFCHLAWLCYSVEGTLEDEEEWRSLGLLHVTLLHVVMEYLELGSTATLYCHGLVHHFQLPRLSVAHSDEAGEAALRRAKRFSLITSTVNDDSIRDCARKGHFVLLSVSLQTC